MGHACLDRARHHRPGRQRHGDERWRRVERAPRRQPGGRPRARRSSLTVSSFLALCVTGRANGETDWRPVKAEEIVDRYPGGDYVGFHSRRYALGLELLAHYAPAAQTLLDVGPSTLTSLVAETYSRSVDSVGFEDVGSNTSGGKHFDFDLNRLPDDTGPAALGTYDVVLCCEVLEHLLVAPQHLLRWLGTHIEGDGVLVVQTPNAAAFDRRVKLLMGRQPYDALDPDRTGARHVRECTYTELREFVAAAGLEVAQATRHAYFDYRFAAHKGSEGRARRLRHVVQNALDRSLPLGLRSGITMVLRPHQ